MTGVQRVALLLCGLGGGCRLLPELLPPAPPVSAGSLPAYEEIITVSGQTWEEQKSDEFEAALCISAHSLAFIINLWETFSTLKNKSMCSQCVFKAAALLFPDLWTVLAQICQRVSAINSGAKVNLLCHLLWFMCSSCMSALTAASFVKRNLMSESALRV